MDESVPTYRKFKTPDEIVAWFKRIKEHSVTLAGEMVYSVNLCIDWCETNCYQRTYIVSDRHCPYVDGQVLPPTSPETDRLVSDLFDFSLRGYSIWCFSTDKFMGRPEFKIYLKRTRDHSTNICPETLDALRMLLS